MVHKQKSKIMTDALAHHSWQKKKEEAEAKKYLSSNGIRLKMQLSNGIRLKMQLERRNQRVSLIQIDKILDLLFLSVTVLHCLFGNTLYNTFLLCSSFYCFVHVADCDPLVPSEIKFWMKEDTKQLSSWLEVFIKIKIK